MGCNCLIYAEGLSLDVNKSFPLSRISISTCFFLAGLVFSSWASRIPDVKDRFGLNEAELGGILFMLPMGSLAALPVAGWVVHRLGSKWVTIISIIVYSFLLFAISIAPSIFILSFILFLFGVIGNFTNISMNAQGLSIQHKMNRPILSSLHAMWSLGAFAAAVLTGWSVKLGFPISVHFLVLVSFVALLSVPCSFPMVKDFDDGTPKKIFAWPTRPLLLLGVICFCVAMSEGAMADWSSLYYRERIHEVTSASTLGYTSFAFCMAMGRFAGDRLIQMFSHAAVIRMNGVLIFSGMALALGIQSPFMVILGFGLVGFGVSSVIPIVYMLAAKSKTMAPATALSAVSSVGFTGFLFGPPMIGFIANGIGLREALGIVALLGMLIVFLSFRLRKADIN